MSVRQVIRSAFSLEEGSASPEEIRQSILSGAHVKGTNLCILVLAILIASIGLNMNSTAVIIGAMIAWYECGFTARFPALFAWNAFTVGLGEAIACYVLGLLLLAILPQIPALRGRLTLRA